MPSLVHEIEAGIAALVAEPVFAAFGKSDAGILVWDSTGTKILWASSAAEPLRRALSHGENGAVELPQADAARLKALAGGLAPRQGMRLERLRLNPIRFAAPLTCACRSIVLPHAGPVLVTAIAGAVPRVSPREGDDVPIRKQSAVDSSDGFIEGLRRRSTVRFVWQADEHARITSVSPVLAEAIGVETAAIVGLTWTELLKRVSEENHGSIANHISRQETWSGEVVYWPLDGGEYEIGVDLAGLPVYDGNRKLTGFRGFGLCRSNSLRPVSAPAPQIRQEMAVTPPVVPAPRAVRPSLPEKLPTPSGNLTETDKLSLREIARALGGRIEPVVLKAQVAHEVPAWERRVDASPPVAVQRQTAVEEPLPQKAEALLDLLPIGVLIHRGEEVLYANRVLLGMVGYSNVDRLAALGVAGLFRDSPVLAGETRPEQPFTITDAKGNRIAVEVRLSSVEWNHVPASLMLIRQSAVFGVVEQLRQTERENHERSERIRELESILATATDGIVTLDEAGRILSVNSSGEALFGYDAREVIGEAVTVLLAPESHIVALDYLDALRLSGVASLLEGGREVIGQVRQGGSISLFMTIARIGSGKLCAVLRDVTAFKKTERELLAAKRFAEEASKQKSDLLAKISHEIRTPLNAIIGFAEIMMEERFGPVENERYKSYLKDMHTSGSHVISLVNDLLDLAKIEAGHMDLNFTSVHLNDLVASCVGMLQQQATRERIVMRTSFAPKLPQVVADERSIRQIVFNLVSNAIKFTDAGGQVIVSTAMTDRGEIVVRVRDTGIGMDENDIAAALEPFRQLATSRQSGGTGLGLPLTKALIEANRGSFEISSARNEGTLVEVIFPPTRVLAE